MCPCVDIHERTSPLVPQQYPAYLVPFTEMICVMGGKWSYSSSFVECWFHGLFKTANSLCNTHIAFSPNVLLESQVVQLYNSTDTGTDWKNSCSILLKRLHFHMVDNLLIAVYAFPKHMLTSLSVDAILLPRYVKWSINFRRLLFNLRYWRSWYAVKEIDRTKINTYTSY